MMPQKSMKQAKTGDISTQDDSFDRLPSPLDSANFFQRLGLWWLNPVVSDAFHNKLSANSIPELPENLLPHNVMQQYERCIKELTISSPEGESVPPSLSVAWRLIRGDILVGSLAALGEQGARLANVMVLREFVLWLKNGGQDTQSSESGLKFAFIMFALTLFSSCCKGFAEFQAKSAAIRLRTAFMTVGFRRILDLPTECDKVFPAGNIYTLTSTDIEALFQGIIFCPNFFSSCIIFTAGICLLVVIAGWIGLAGIGVLLIMMPIQLFFVTQLKKSTKFMLKATDKRNKHTIEILTGIKFIKLWGFENLMSDRLRLDREEEVGHIKTFTFWRNTFYMFSGGLPNIVALTLFGSYYAKNNTMEAEVVVTVIALLSVLILSFFAIPMGLSNYAQAKVVFSRFDDLLKLPKKATNQKEHQEKFSSTEEPLIQVQGAFKYSKENYMTENEKEEGRIPPTILSLPTNGLEVEKNCCLCVVGPVGSGKTSLIRAVLGEMVEANDRSFSKIVASKVALVSQEHFILSGTLESNILFGNEMDRKRYNYTLECCELLEDMNILPDGDQTQIGDRGINLSGGQKLRVSLARAVYSGADVVLLDDPLAAVDAHVAKKLYHNVIMGGALEKTTRILVTNQVQYLSGANHIAFLERGAVVERGSFLELTSIIDGAFAQMVKENSANTDHEKVEKKLDLKKVDTGDIKKLVKDETIEEGDMNWTTFLFFFKTAGRGKYFLAILTGLSFFLTESASMSAEFWASQIWSDEKWDGKPASDIMYFTVYSLLVLTLLLMMFVRAGFHVLFQGRASRELHHRMLDSILSSPIFFFETTPTGRVQNRFSHDLSEVDNTLISVYFFWALVMFSRATIQLGIIVYGIYWFSIVLAVLIYLYRKIYLFYFKTQLQLQRIESVSRTPLYNILSEAQQGVKTIRAYRKEGDFIQRHQSILKANSRAFFYARVAETWLLFQLQLSGSFVVLSCAVLLVTVGNSEGDAKDAGSGGITLSYAVVVTFFVQFCVQMFCNIQSKMNCVERILEYSDLKKEEDSSSEKLALDGAWPMEGRIEFRNVVMRYRPDLEPSLRGVSFSMERGGIRVGIVGRTGAGKTSIFAALFRLYKLDAGKILIDNIDVSCLKLSDLRKNLTIIPQDPTLFEGTVRSNLDPLSLSEGDSELWQALERVGLKEIVKQYPEQLDAPITANGSNLSSGQRQLICMARALLRKSKILILDEATASIDSESDAEIQRVIRSEFQDTTILIIAHRINTIIDSDLILVMEAGEIVEKGSPEDLLNECGNFYSLCKASGISKEKAIKSTKILLKETFI